MSTLWRFDDRRGSIARETDISAECAPTEENPWVPRADEDQGRAEGVETPAGQGAQTADRLTGRFPRHERLTTGSDFQALFQRGKRVDRPSMTILWRESVDARRVGFAVSRQVRRAVAKNRVRRRLREAYRATRAAAPARAILVAIGKPLARSEPVATLANQLRGAPAAIPGARAYAVDRLFSDPRPGVAARAAGRAEGRRHRLPPARPPPPRGARRTAAARATAPAAARHGGDAALQRRGVERGRKAAGVRPQVPRGQADGDRRRPGTGRVADRRRCQPLDRKSTRLNSSHSQISYAVFCLK